MKATTESPRRMRGLEIANKKSKQVDRIDDSNYEVLSQSGNGSYLVSEVEEEWVCECPDHRFRGVKCKHVWAVEFSLAFRRELQSNVVIQRARA